MKFNGTLDLKAIMFNIAACCKWSGTRNHFQCRLPSGAVLNWWASTGTITVQGPDEAAAELEAGLKRVAWQPHNQTRQSKSTLSNEPMQVEYMEGAKSAGSMALTHLPELPRFPKRT